MLNEQDLEQLSAYLDGELTGLQASGFQKRLLAESELRAEYEIIKHNDEKLRKYLSGKVTPAVTDEQGVVPFTRVNHHKNGDKNYGESTGKNNRVMLAMVASAAFIMFAAAYFRGMDSEPLQWALETTPSGEQYTMGADFIMPVASFQDHDGQICREYVTSVHEGAQQTEERAVACRLNGFWRVVLNVPASNVDASTQYIPAGAGDVEAIDNFISDNIEGNAFGSEKELEMIRNNWR